MKVKIGNKVYDPNNVPIMVILSPEDKQNIANASPPFEGANIRYCCFPEDVCVEELEEWMNEEIL